MKVLLRVLVVLWLVVVVYSGLLFYGFYTEYKAGERAVSEYITRSGVSLDSLRSVKDPSSQYRREQHKSPERLELLAMAMAVQLKTTDRYYWPKQLGQWVLFLILLPAVGLSVLKWGTSRLWTAARTDAEP